MVGKVIIVAAPSGSGKTTLVKHLLKEVPSLAFSISATTRPKREWEIDGRDYHFVSAATFECKIEAGEFLEYEEVYEGIFYGSLKKDVDEMLLCGKHVIFDVDVKGALNIKKHYRTQALALFIRPPSIQALKSRLRGRQSESETSLAARIGKAREELLFEPSFDQTVVNDQLYVAKAEIVNIVEKFICKDSFSSF